MGIKHGRKTSEESPTPVWDKVDAYVAELNDRSGAVNCRQLTGSGLKTEDRTKRALYQGSRLCLHREIEIRCGKGSTSAEEIDALLATT